MGTYVSPGGDATVTKTVDQQLYLNGNLFMI